MSKYILNSLIGKELCVYNNNGYLTKIIIYQAYSDFDGIYFLYKFSGVCVDDSDKLINAYNRQIFSLGPSEYIKVEGQKIPIYLTCSSISEGITPYQDASGQYVESMEAAKTINIEGFFRGKDFEVFEVKVPKEIVETIKSRFDILDL